MRMIPVHRSSSPSDSNATHNAPSDCDSYYPSDPPLMSVDGVDMDLDLSVELAGLDNTIPRSNPRSEPFISSTSSSKSSSSLLAARPQTFNVVALSLASHSKVPCTSITPASATTSSATPETAPSSGRGSSLSRENINSPYPSGLSDAPNLTSCMRKLSDINIALIQHLISISEVGPDGKAADQEDQATNEPKYAIDEVFHLSHSFIDTISHLLPKLPPPYQGDSVSSLAPSMLNLDAASELLIFSCYLRLIETYERILRHMQVCCHQAETHPAREYQHKAPGWSIGSFSISSNSKTQSLFIVHLMETMLTRSRDLVTELVVLKATYGYRGNWECFGGMSLVIVPDLALQAIRTRERGTLRLVQQIKNTLT